MKIICLCGSTKFKTYYEVANREETLKGNIVLSVGFFNHADNMNISDETKIKVDLLHLKKIDMADEIFVINKGKYIGESTRKEILYAEMLGKPIRYLEPRWE